MIIIQGDHGLDTEARMAILNAYYLPGDGAKMLYPTITPVNSFRVVFNAYFGQEYPILPDTSLYSDMMICSIFPRFNIPVIRRNGLSGFALI